MWDFKKNRAIYHILLWTGIYLLWVLIFRKYSVPLSKTMSIEFCYLIFITIDFYTISNFIIPKIFLKKKYALFIGSILAVIAVSAWLRALLAIQISYHYFKPAPVPDFTTLYVNSIVNISFWVFLITIGKMLVDKIKTQQTLESLERERVKNELDYLKAQINPHALFNSLNTIYGHIDKSNQTARNILLQFSELLRYQLYDCGEEKVFLNKELAYIRNYICFQQLKKDDSLLVKLEIEQAENGLKIAPLLLVVLVENAFKFSSSYAGKDNIISINIHTNGTILNSTYYNTTDMNPSLDSGSSKGIGLLNLRRRLELLYPNKHQLTTKIGDHFYETHLTVNLA